MWQPIVNLAQASWESSNHGRVDEQKRHRPPTAAVRKTLSRKSEISPTRVFYPYERVLPFLCRRVAQTYLTALRYFIEIKRNVSWWAHAVDRPSSAAASSRCAAIRVTLIQPGGAGGVPPRGQVQHQRPPQQPLELQPPPLRVPQSHRVFGTAGGRPF